VSKIVRFPPEQRKCAEINETSITLSVEDFMRTLDWESISLVGAHPCTLRCRRRYQQLPITYYEQETKTFISLLSNDD
jgi:hypothetical protein